MYRFFIKNYNNANSTFVSSETEVYSVPIAEQDKAFSNPSIKTEMGKAGSFEFEVEPWHPFFSSWIQMKTLLRVEYDGDTIFRGRVLTVDNNHWGNRKIHAEGDLAFLLDSQQEGVKDDDRSEITALQYLQQVISAHNSQMSDEPDKQMTLGEAPGQYTAATATEQRVITDSRKFGSSSWQSSMSALENMQKTFGGMFRTRYVNGICYLDWLESYFRSEVNTQPMEITKNLIDISDTEDVDGVFTVLIPVGTFESQNLYLPGKYVTVPSIIDKFTDAELNSGYHTKQDYANAFNDRGHIYKVQQFNDAGTEEELKKYAYDYIRHNYYGKLKSFTIRALDMHHLDSTVEKYLVGDHIPVIYPDADNLVDGHSGRVTRILTATAITYRPHSPDDNEYSVGIPSSLRSKDYGSMTNKKLSSQTSADSGYASSGISSLSSQLSSLPTTVTEVTQQTKDYSALAWAFILDNTGKNYYVHTAYNNMMSAYPNANDDWQVKKIGWTMIHNKMSKGYFGKFDYGYFTIDARSDQVKVMIRSGVEATNTLKYSLPYIANYLKSLRDGYIAYAAAHPGWPENSATVTTSTLLDGDGGLNLLSSALSSLNLPSGIDLIGEGGEGFNISGASSIFTTLLTKLGITTSGGVLSEENMQKVLENTSCLFSIVDGTTGKFSLDKLIALLPSDLKDSITNGTFSVKATNWLKQKFPILRLALGDSENSQLHVDWLESFVNSVPLLAPETLASISQDGGVTINSGASFGDGTTEIDASGTITLKSGLLALLDENGHVTQESFLKVFPRLSNSFVSGVTPLTLTTAASNYVIKKFPELGSLVNSSHRLTLSAIETYINEQIQNGSLRNTSEPTVKLDGDTGSVNGVEVNLGSDATGTANTVEIDGRTGSQLLGKINQQWAISLNAPIAFDEPVAYVDSEGATHTMTTQGADGKHYLPQGTIKAQEFSVPEIPSFRTKFASIDTLFAKTVFTDTLYADAVHAGFVHSNTLESTVATFGYVKADDLYVSGTGEFGGYIKTDKGLYTSTGSVYAKKLYSYNDTHVYGTLYANNGITIVDTYGDENYSYGIVTATFGSRSSNGVGVRRPILATGSLNVGLDANVDPNNPGHIIISFADNSGGGHDSANFNIADTQFFQDQVSAVTVALNGTSDQPTEGRSGGNVTEGTYYQGVTRYSGAWNGYTPNYSGYVYSPKITISRSVWTLTNNGTKCEQTFTKTALASSSNDTPVASRTVVLSLTSTQMVSTDPNKWRVQVYDGNANTGLYIDVDATSRYNAGWEAARDSTGAFPVTRSTSDDYITVKRPNTTPDGNAVSYTYALDVDDDYVYLKHSRSTVVARISNPAWQHGYDHAAGLRTTLNTSSNGTFNAPFGYSQVVVDVNQNPGISNLVFWAYDQDTQSTNNNPNGKDWTLANGAWSSVGVTYDYNGSTYTQSCIFRGGSSGGSSGPSITGLFYSNDSLSSGKAKVRFSNNTYSEYSITLVGSTPYDNM